MPVFSYPKEKRNAFLVALKMALDLNSKTTHPKPRYKVLTDISHAHGISERTGRGWAEKAGVITVIPRHVLAKAKSKRPTYSQKFKDDFLHDCKIMGANAAARKHDCSATNKYNWLREKAEARLAAKGGTDLRKDLSKETIATSAVVPAFSYKNEASGTRVFVAIGNNRVALSFDTQGNCYNIDQRRM